MTLQRRVFALVLIGGFFVATPVIRQVFGLGNGWLRAWQMFAGLSTDLCEVQLYVRADGADTPVDRLAALGFDRRADAAPNQRLLKDVPAVVESAQAVCKKLGEGVDLRAVARCATMQGWEPALAREENLCAVARPVRARPTRGAQ